MKRLVLDPVDEVTAFYVQDDKQPNHHNEFGGSIGGPIVKDRLFFFGSYSPRIETAAPTTTSSPNGTERRSITRTRSGTAGVRQGDLRQPPRATPTGPASVDADHGRPAR